VRFAEDVVKLPKLPPLILVLALLLFEVMPLGQLFDSVTKKRIFIVAGLRRFAAPLDPAFQILCEIIEAE
jgi:hypothetical protein